MKRELELVAEKKMKCWSCRHKYIGKIKKVFLKESAFWKKKEYWIKCPKCGRDNYYQDYEIFI